MTPAVQVAFLRLDFVWTFEPLAVGRGTDGKIRVGKWDFENKTKQKTIDKSGLVNGIYILIQFWETF